ncbi:MAG: peptide deformylase [Fidelibacterota bacterium]
MVRPIVTYGEPILRKKTEKISNFSDIESIIQDMFETMYEEEGIGLAANQIGVSYHLMVVDVTHTEEWDKPMVFANAQIIGSQGESVMEEGCLSLPEIRFEVTRPEEIVLKYQDQTGKQFTSSYTGLMARVIQHEIDHLNGILMIDYLSPLQRLQYKSQLQEITGNRLEVTTEQFSKGIVL